MCSRLLQFSNADAEILSTFFPMETLEMDVQFIKAQFLISRTLSGMTSSPVSPVQPLNAFPPNFSKPLGKVNDVKDVQFSNAPPVIKIIPSVNSTDVILEQL